MQQHRQRSASLAVTGPIAYRRSAIITSLLHKMKVSQCYFTPTRARDDSFVDGLSDWMAKIVGENLRVWERAYKLLEEEKFTYS